MMSLSWGSPTGEGDADVSVLLLTADGKVRSDGDFYFYNNPVAADGRARTASPNACLSSYAPPRADADAPTG